MSWRHCFTQALPALCLLDFFYPLLSDIPWALEKKYERWLIKRFRTVQSTEKKCLWSAHPHRMFQCSALQPDALFLILFPAWLRLTTIAFYCDFVWFIEHNFSQILILLMNYLWWKKNHLLQVALWNPCVNYSTHTYTHTHIHTERQRNIQTIYIWVCVCVYTETHTNT